MAAALDAGADDLRDDGDSWEVVSPPEAFPAGARSGQGARHRARRRRSRDAAAELRQARRQAGAADGQADGSARGPRGHRRRSGRTPTSRRRRSRPRWRERSSGSIPAPSAPATAASSAIGSRHRARHLRSLSRSRRARHSPTSCTHPRRADGAARRAHRPDCVAIEDIFHARNVRSALKLGHARGVALLAASEAGRAGRRIRAGRDQARGRRLRPRREAAGAADGQAAARPRPSRRRRTTPPMRWRSPSATCIATEPSRGRDRADATPATASQPPRAGACRAIVARSRPTS